MKTALLFIEDNVLKLKTEKQTIVPNGMEIFRWKFRNQDTINGYTVTKEDCNISYGKKSMVFIHTNQKKVRVIK